MPKMKRRLGPVERAEAQAELEKRLLRGEITVGKAIREMRQTWFAIHQDQMARMVGVSKNTLGAIERDEGSEKISTLEKVLKPLGYRITIVPTTPRMESE